MLLCFVGCEAPQNPRVGKGEKHRPPPTALHLFVFLDTVSYILCERFPVLLRRTEQSDFFYSGYNFIGKLRCTAPDPQLGGISSYPTAGVGLVYLKFWKVNGTVFGRHLKFHFLVHFFLIILFIFVRFHLSFSYAFFCSKIQSPFPVKENPYVLHSTILKLHFSFS